MQNTVNQTLLSLLSNSYPKHSEMDDGKESYANMI